MAHHDEDTIVIADKIYIPLEHINMRKAEKLYTHNIFKESECQRCPNKPLRPNFECDQCPAYSGSVRTCSLVYKNEIDYIGLPMGARDKIERKFGIRFKDFNIVDKRVRKKFDYNIKSSIKLRDYQEESIEGWYYYKYGLIVAPPRSGKTVIMLATAIELGMRAILLASQHEFLTQFIDHVEEYTNLPRLQDKYGIPLYGFPKNPKDFNTLQLAVCTYQQFTSAKQGRKRFRLMNENFGTLMVDEAHRSASNEFSKVVSKSRARIRMGVTGTEKRKDGRHRILFDVIGPVVDRVTIDQLQAKIIVHVCDYVKSKSAYRGPAGYVYACKFLATHAKRHAEILKFVGKDLKNGHCIVIPVIFKDHVFELVKAINDLYGEGMAEPFVGGGTKKNKDLRAATLDRAKLRKTRVIVGIRSILQLGLNVPAWSCLYNIIPISNEPNWKQESSRILTPDPDKRDPIIRLFVDPNIGLSLGCFISTYKQCLSFKHEPTTLARQRAMEMFELHGPGKKALLEAEQAVDLEYENDTATDYLVGAEYTGPTRKKKENKGRKSALGKGAGLFGGSTAR